jgi:4-methyl-5(b-hydroxyethyl)-thiazole monophosphate biosynthesis
VIYLYSVLQRGALGKRNTDETACRAWEEIMIYVFLADGFEEIEALTPVDMLRRAGGEVTTVGVGGKNIRGAHGITVTADITDDEASKILEGGETPEMVVLPGGMPGADNLNASAVVDSFIRSACNSGAFVGAICAAPYILGDRGILKGKRAVCYPGFENHLTGAAVSDAGAVRDGNIITGRAMGAALPFSLELVEAMFGRAKRDVLAKGVLA